MLAGPDHSRPVTVSGMELRKLVLARKRARRDVAESAECAAVRRRMMPPHAAAVRGRAVRIPDPQSAAGAADSRVAAAAGGGRDTIIRFKFDNSIRS